MLVAQEMFEIDLFVQYDRAVVFMSSANIKLFFIKDCVQDLSFFNFLKL